MWLDLHHQYARERHARLLRDADREPLAAGPPTRRRCFRLRLGRLQLCWNCAVVLEQ